jgi:hypothetical protein
LDLIGKKYDPEVEIEEMLEVYETFHHLTRDSTWGKVPWPCSFVTSHAHCGCKYAARLTSVFDASIAVPNDCVTAEPSLHKKIQKLSGAAGPKRARLIAERRKETGNETSVHGDEREWLYWGNGTAF